MKYFTTLNREKTLTSGFFEQFSDREKLFKETRKIAQYFLHHPRHSSAYIMLKNINNFLKYNIKD